MGGESPPSPPYKWMKNPMRTISKYEYKKAGQFFHWGDRSHYAVWFTGEDKRHKRTEVMLPRLVRNKELISKRFGKKKVYTVPRRKNDQNIEHGLACTEGLVRFYRSDPSGIIVPEKDFRSRGYGIVPEWGIQYEDRAMLLFEFCTPSNFYDSGHKIVKSKITRYANNLHLIEDRFDARATILFVCDAPRKDVDEFVYKNLPLGDRFMFTDYETFKDWPCDEQLYAPIYIWGYDGWPYPLRNENV